MPFKQVEIKEKIEDYVTGENIYFINIYKKIKVKEILKVKIIEEFSIFNTIKKNRNNGIYFFAKNIN